MNTARFVRLAPVVLGGALVACTSVAAPDSGTAGGDATGASSAMADSGDEAVVREWTDAVNQRDRDAALALMADELTVDVATMEADEAIGTVLETWCPFEIESVERVGDEYLVRAAFTEDPDGVCIAGSPGITSTFVMEVTDGKVTRIP